MGGLEAAPSFPRWPRLAPYSTLPTTQRHGMRLFQLCEPWARQVQGLAKGCLNWIGSPVGWGAGSELKGTG